MADETTLDKDKYRFNEETAELFTTDKDNISLIKGRLDITSGKLYIGTESDS